MKRYTLHLQPQGPGIVVEDLRREVEQTLLRLHPRITYKMGKANKDVDGNFVVEFAADGQRHLLDEAFSSRSWNLPVRFDRLSWGWMLENEDAALLASANRPFESDPLAGVAALEGVGEYVLSRRRLNGRYLALMISTLALILTLVGNVIYPRSPVLMVLYAVVFAIFMFALNDTPLDIRVYGEKISLRLDSLAVKFWLLNKPATREWESIWGVDYTNPICEVLSKNGKLRFLLSKRFGCLEQSVILKTIVRRAGLSYVEGTFRKLTYRKPDA